jgi:hypothetical protein
MTPMTKAEQGAYRAALKAIGDSSSATAATLRDIYAEAWTYGHEAGARDMRERVAMLVDDDLMYSSAAAAIRALPLTPDTEASDEA